MNIFSWLTDTSGLTPHGFCLFWQPGLMLLDVVADGLITLAYFSIPLSLALLIRRRPDFPYRKLATLFMGFIVACGTSHAFSILTLWVPAYRLETTVKLLTAILSIVTAAVLWRLIPRLLDLPSAAKMAALNETLMATIAEQDKTAAALTESQSRLISAQDQLRSANADLERRIAERTAEQVLLNASIARSEARFRQVVEAAPTAMVMVNSAGLIVLVNAQAEHLFGYSRSDLLGAQVEMLMPIKQRALHPDLRAQFYHKPRTRQMGGSKALLAMTKNGGQIEVEIGLNPIETDEGLMVLAAIVDISERERLAAQLRQSQKIEAVGRVTTGVAHDFNNLLQVVGGSLELLVDAVADRPEALAWGEVALSAITRGGELTSRLLSFSGKQLLHARPIMVAKLLEELRKLIAPLFESPVTGPIEFQVHCRTPDLSVVADAGQLEAALINLAVNARDAMPGGGCLRIAAYESDADPALVRPGRYGVITVSDTGIGMDSETLAQACEPFFTTKGPQGTGLGLSMVQGFARQSGGEAHLISVPLEGTTVELWLPSANLRPSPPHSNKLILRQRVRILLVDDSEDVLLIVGSFLRHSGYQVTALGGAGPAIAAVETAGTFDVLITDYLMPGMNGLDLLLRVREIQPGIVGMIITGFSEATTLPELSGVEVLRKPFNRAELAAKLDEILHIEQA